MFIIGLIILYFYYEALYGNFLIILIAYLILVTIVMYILNNENRLWLFKINFYIDIFLSVVITSLSMIRFFIEIKSSKIKDAFNT